MRKDKGITLIALVVTIVVLIILAAVSINLLLGNNGIVTKSRNAKLNYELAANEEDTQLKVIEEQIDELTAEIPKTYKHPYIPEGFTHTEGTWNSGFTIKNTTTNDEFVWVPCTLEATEETVAFSRIKTILPYNYAGMFTEVTDQTGAKADKIRESVGKYGGFYIAKYEASSSDSTQNGIVRSLPNKTPWVSISRTNAITKAEEMVNTTDGVKSALISGECWDTTLQWMVTKSDNASLNEGYDTNSTGKGHYNAESSIKTGSNSKYAINNIYDMAGNVLEWTTENGNDHGYDYVVYRGGWYDDSGSGIPAAHRSYHADNADGVVGFRPVLYK